MNASVAQFYYPPRHNVPPMMNVQWISCSNGNLPDSAIHCGFGSDGKTKLYVARARHMNALIPGKLHPKYKCCYIPWGGKEHAISHYEVLVAPQGCLQWVDSSHGVLLPNAVVGGHSETGEQLFIGRAHHQGLLTVGKVHPSHNCCYVPYCGKEIGYVHYQVLVRSF